MRTRLALLSLIMILSVVVSGSHLGKDNRHDMNNLLSIIADPQTNKERLIRAIQSLGTVTETANFWTKIANSEQYSQYHRRIAVFQLFKRYVSRGMTLSELAQVVDNPSWLAKENISIVDSLGGKIPVKWTFEDTVLVLGVFPELPDGRYDHWAIYLRVSGKVTGENFIRLLRGESVSEDVSNAKILEFAFSPDDPTEVE